MASRYRGTVSGASEKAGAPLGVAVKADGTRSERRSWLQSGMRASHFSDDSTTRKGMFSALDSDKRAANERRLNDVKTSVMMAAIDPATGRPIPNATVTLGDRILRSNTNGHFRILDKQAMELQQRLREEMDAEVNRATEYCLASDATAQEVLNLRPEVYEELLQAKPAERHGADAKAISESVDMPHPYWEYEARVRFLQLFPADSLEFRRGIAKMRALVAWAQPYFDAGGTTEEGLKAATVAPEE